MLLEDLLEVEAYAKALYEHTGAGGPPIWRRSGELRNPLELDRMSSA